MTSTVSDLNALIAVQEKLLEQLRKKRDGLQAVSDMDARAALRAREYVENTEALQEAKRLGRNISFEAHDGCEVTVTPDGKVLFNAADWY